MKEMSNHFEQKFTQLKLKVDNRLHQLHSKVDSRFSAFQRENNLSEKRFHKLIEDV